MTTTKNVISNRRNAQKSTGPKTKIGKDVSSKNSLKHGILSSFPLLTTENPDQYLLFCEKVHSAISPESDLERLLTERLATLLWRLNRVYSVETGALNTNDEMHEDLATLFESKSFSMAVLSRYEANIERTIEKTLKQIEQLKELRAPSNTNNTITVTIADYTTNNS